jgi:hypothetical protein
MRRDVVELVRDADPVDPARLEAWARSPDASRIFDRIVQSDPASSQEASDVKGGRPGRTRSRAARLTLLAAAILIIGGGIAAAGSLLLGQPAPEKVRQDFRNLDAGLPADIQLNPNVVEAHSVAATGTSTLYYASLNDGGYCTEIVTAEGPRGATCTTASQAGARPISMAVPFTDPITPDSPVSVGGRVNVSTAATLFIRYPDGTEDAIPFGESHFFVFDLPPAQLPAVHREGFELVVRDASGAQVGTALLPSDWAAEMPDNVQPIFVSTISDGDDFTKVLGIEGNVNADGAVSLELRYPDGSVVKVPLAANGTYRMLLPADRQDDLYLVPGTLVAKDATGKELARAPVAAVAFWRGQERSGTGG